MILVIDANKKKITKNKKNENQLKLTFYYKSIYFFLIIRCKNHLATDFYLTKYKIGYIYLYVHIGVMCCIA